MKYIAIIDTDDFKDFEFFEDGNGKYLVTKDAGAVNNEWIPLYFKECEQGLKTGHWITKQNEVFKYYCDKCGTGDNLRTNYCPNCGARMVEPQERSDKE